MASFPLEQIAEEGYQIQATKALFIASLTMLIYDHLLTLKIEVRYFWRQKMSLTSALFYFNRYYTHIAFIFIAFLFLSPAGVKPDICRPASAFLPLGGTLPISLASSLLLTTRVYAIYNCSKALLGFLLFYLSAATGVSIWLYGFAGHQPLPLQPIQLDAFQICIDQTSPSIPQNVAIIWIIIQCSFDLTILLLTVYRSIHVYLLRRSFSDDNLYRTILEDGILYFLCIFSSNFAWAMMVLTATPGVKYIIAIPNLAICATAASRISLNLRARASFSGALACISTDVYDFDTLSRTHSFRRRLRRKEVETSGGTISLDASTAAFGKAHVGLNGSGSRNHVAVLDMTPV